MINPELTTLPKSDPAVALRFRDRQYAADLIATALLQFDLFTFLRDNGPTSLEQLCEKFGWQSRPADVLMTLCRASGFVATDADGRSTVTDAGREHMCSDSPWGLKPYYKPIADSPILQSYIEILKTGKPANWQAKSDGSDWHESMKDPQFASDFTALMNCRGITFGQHLAQTIAPELDGYHHLLDVGGGSGIYAATLVARCPAMRATVLEQPPVDAIAAAEIQRHGLADKIDVLSADMFDDAWTTSQDRPFDVILLSNLLHDWDWAEAQSIVDKAAATLPSGGLLVVHGAILDAEKTGPLPVAEYSALLMNITQGKCYSESEYGSMMTAAGLVPGPVRPTAGDRSFQTARKP